MSIKHVVKQGEHLSGIAALHGFSDYKIVWSFPENAELKRKRKDPHILFPGDIVAIPEPRIKTVSKPAGAAHEFVLAGVQLQIVLRMLDPFEAPITDAPAIAANDEVDDNGKPTATLGSSVRSDAEGKIRFSIKSSATDAEVRVFVSDPLPSPVPEPALRDKFDLLIGQLDPIAEPSGQRGRLNNMGYFAGITNGAEDAEQLFWALEEFQFDHGILEAKADGTRLPNGNLTDPQNKIARATLQKLVEVHGDKEPV